MGLTWTDGQPKNGVPKTKLKRCTTENQIVDRNRNRRDRYLTNVYRGQQRTVTAIRLHLLGLTTLRPRRHDSSLSVKADSRNFLIRL